MAMATCCAGFSPPMAAMDGLADKLEATQQTFIGSQEVRDQKAIERGKMRTQIGTEMIRELELK